MDAGGPTWPQTQLIWANILVPWQHHITRSCRTSHLWRLCSMRVSFTPGNVLTVCLGAQSANMPPPSGPSVSNRHHDGVMWWVEVTRTSQCQHRPNIGVLPNPSVTSMTGHMPGHMPGSYEADAAEMPGARIPAQELDRMRAWFCFILCRSSGS